MRAKFGCGVEISLAECWSPTTPSRPRERNFQAECFEHLHCCLPDMRFVIADKCIVPKNDAVVAAVSDRRVRSEERRVGKECRSRWGRDHLRKKEKRT